MKHEEELERWPVCVINMNNWITLCAKVFRITFSWGTFTDALNMDLALGCFVYRGYFHGNCVLSGIVIVQVLESKFVL